VTKLLTLKDTKRRERPEEDLELLEQIREVNPVAGMQFLEYLVLQKRSTVCCSEFLKALHFSDHVPCSQENSIHSLLCHVLNDYWQDSMKTLCQNSGVQRV
jgi:vacuolar protein sorting-associated protein 3